MSGKGLRCLKPSKKWSLTNYAENDSYLATINKISIGFNMYVVQKELYIFGTFLRYTFLSATCFFPFSSQCIQVSQRADESIQ